MSHLVPPTAAERAGETPTMKLRLVARAAVKAAKVAGRPVSGRELVNLMNVKAAITLKRAGIDFAVADGALRTTPGERRAVVHEYVHDLSDPNEVRDDE